MDAQGRLYPGRLGRTVDTLHAPGHHFPMHSHRLSLEQTDTRRKMHQLQRVLFRVRIDQRTHCRQHPDPATADYLEVAGLPL